MSSKEIPIIFVGLSAVIAALVLGWSVFVKSDVLSPVEPIVVGDDNQSDEVEDDSFDVEDDGADDYPDVNDDVIIDDNISEIDISDWKVYRNEEFGYEIKHPEN